MAATKRRIEWKRENAARKKGGKGESKAIKRVTEEKLSKRQKKKEWVSKKKGEEEEKEKKREEDERREGGAGPKEDDEKGKEREEKGKNTTKICYNKADYEQINNEIMNIDWKSEMKEQNTTNEKWSIFRNKIQEIINKSVPTKTIKPHKNSKHTFPVDQETLEKIRKKHALSKKVAATNDPEVKPQYYKVRNQVKKLTRKLRKDYEQTLATKAKSDPK
ncbi:protein MNN4-like [Mizuhopecten yessoensis]|uniref:protein MNN4-like n=1 Tax=Mizuhopecten yessoensis TaxID=6573 RepID=UPI000B458C43|nr:protein MNN4-like [Mizuhopecten yessoensis]